MKKLLLLTFGIALLSSCNCNYKKKRTLAESQRYKIYSIVNGEAFSELRVIDKQVDQDRLLITTHRSKWVESDSTIVIDKDSIPAIESVRILSIGEEPLKLLIEEKCDRRNVTSYIFVDGQKTVLRLPSNGGLIGITDEDGLLVMQSYDYYAGGGRYNLIQVYDHKGEKRHEISLKEHPELENSSL